MVSAWESKFDMLFVSCDFITYLRYGKCPLLQFCSKKVKAALMVLKANVLY